MVKLLNYVFCLGMFVAVLSFNSCQEDGFDEVESIEDTVITLSSTLAGLIQRTVSNDGSVDNIVDSSSCFDINFPYSVVVSGIALTINTVDDFDGLEKLLDASENDNDEVVINFPVTITMSDYSEFEVANNTELIAFSSQCIEGGSDTDIECIDVVYPVQIFSYDPSFQETGSVLVKSDAEMRLFFASLTNTDLISIEFPLELRKKDGSTVKANKNMELANLIESEIGTCNEDDNSNYNDDDFTKESLDELLIKCPWLVVTFVRESQDTNARYTEYVLSFDEGGRVLTRDAEGDMRFGNWSTVVIDYRVKLYLEFEFLEDFNAEWFVYEIDEEKIKLHDLSGDEKIILKKACEEPIVYCGEDFVLSELQKCKWLSTNIEIQNLDDFRIDFSGMNIQVIDLEKMVIDEGAWEIEEAVLTFSGLSRDFETYNGAWKIVDCSSERFKLIREDSYLIIEKECE